MPVDDRTIAIAAAIGLPVYRLRRLEFQQRGPVILAWPEYEFRDADADRLVEVLRRYPVGETAGVVAVAGDAEHF